MSFVSNWLLASVAATAALALRPAGLMAQLRLADWLEIVVGIVVLDFSVGYLSHRTMHMWPAMWRFHQIHHSDPFVDVTTTYRTHPVETVWRFLFAIVPVWLLGIPAQAVVIQRLLQATNGVIEHAQHPALAAARSRAVAGLGHAERAQDPPLARRSSETNSNYANLVTLYDRAAGHLHAGRAGARSVVYGLDDAERLSAASFPALLAMPFQDRGSGRTPPDTKVRIEASAGR